MLALLAALLFVALLVLLLPLLGLLALLALLLGEVCVRVVDDQLPGLQLAPRGGAVVAQAPAVVTCRAECLIG